MKRCLVSLVAGLVVFGSVGSMSAAIVTYSFRGEVTSITRDVEITEGLIAIGDPVEFYFNLDFDRPGSQVRYNGQYIERTDHDNEAERVDYFWTDYVGGSDIGPIGEIGTPNPNFFAEFNYGLSVNRKVDGVIVQDTGYLYGGPNYNWVSIENYSKNVQDWEAGSRGFGFRHIVRNQDDDDAWIRGNVELVEMSPLAAVPEPASAILVLVVGLVGFTVIRTWFRKRSANAR